MACIIQYKGKTYSYEQFATLLHNGALRELIDDGTIDDSAFQGGKLPTSLDDVINAIKRAMPKVKVVVSSDIDGAGRVQGNTITINPEYAGKDTPIHEAGHILIDALGESNSRVKAGIEQLRDTDFWTKIEEQYPELDEVMLGKEVLAQAIGIEGEGIFDDVKEQSKFRQILNYIFDRLKQLFGIDKNVAKSLARQIISGIGTKELTGTNEKVQEAKKGRRKIEQTEEEKALTDLVERVIETENISEHSIQDLAELSTLLTATPFNNNAAKTKLENALNIRIGLALKERGIEMAEGQVDRQLASNADINKLNVFMKVLSHFDNAFPQMQAFSKLWNSAYFNKMKEARAEKNTHDNLAKAVISERNKKLGIVGNAQRLLTQALTDQKHKYFSFLDKGDGKLITVSEARAKGLSDAQIKYVQYVRELLGKRKGLEKEASHDVEMDVLKLDKGFYEKFQSDGYVVAASSFFGTDENLLNTEIEFTNPLTGKKQVAKYRDVQSAIQKYADKGLAQKAEAFVMMTKYGIAARLKLKDLIKRGEVKKKGKGQYTLDDEGNLRSKFDNKRPDDRDYSKDFYSAVNMYIDDSMHIKHISPLVPLTNAIEYLSKVGAFDMEGNKIHSSQKNLAEYMKKWTQLHVLQQPDETHPALDKTLKTLRFLTSATTMWFNAPANAMNLVIGNYNNWRDTDGKIWAKGQARLFGKPKYASDIIKKYVAIANDFDSNPIMTGKDFFSKLGMIGQQWGEYQIQGSGLLGLMDEKDFNSFEYKKNKYGVKELVVKEGVNEKELEDRILALIDKVSDVQGKYSAKDRRNIMNNEVGKIALQFKVWMPDWWRVRFGDKGSWTNMVRGGFEELRNDIRDKGTVKAFWENKDFMRNLKGLATVGLLMALVYDDDEDEEKTYASQMFQKALSDVLFIFDPEQLKFTINRPVAAVGTVEKLINAGDHLFALEADDFYKRDNKWGDEGDSKLRGDVMNFVPGRKIIEEINENEE